MSVQRLTWPFTSRGEAFQQQITRPPSQIHKSTRFILQRLPSFINLEGSVLVD